MKPIVSIQYLRAAAAILVVVFHHANAIRADYAPGAFAFPVGAFGVDIFFVISGFIMWTIAAARPLSPQDFLKRRIIRIAPIYWAVTLATAFVAVEGGVRLNPNPDISWLASSLFFVPHWSLEHPGIVAPVAAPGWTLNLEMFFYTLFAATLFLPQRLRLGALTCSLFALASTRLVAGEPGNAALNLYSESVIAEFGFGVFLGWLYLNRPAVFAYTRRNICIGGALIVLGLMTAPAFNAEHDLRGLVWGAPALAIVAGALLLEPAIARRSLHALKFLGDASYSIYLTHIMAMAVSQRTIGAALAPEAPLLTLAIETIFAVLIGCCAYLFVEKPLTRVAHDTFSAPRSALVAQRAPAP